MLKLIEQALYSKRLRQVLSAVCAIVFLFVSFAHSSQHAALAAPTETAQFTLIGLGDPADPPSSTDAPGEQYHGCMMVGIAISAAAVCLIFVAAALSIPKLNNLTPQILLAETPPPIPTS